MLFLARAAAFVRVVPEVHGSLLGPEVPGCFSLAARMLLGLALVGALVTAHCLFCLAVLLARVTATLN